MQNNIVTFTEEDTTNERYNKPYFAENTTNERYKKPYFAEDNVNSEQFQKLPAYFSEENKNTERQNQRPGYFAEEIVNSELCVKLPEYFTDNVRQYTVIKNEAEETDLQRETRQSKDAARAAARRRRETSPEKRKRLAQSAAHIAMKRKMETPEQRENRLAKDAARTAERRKRETFAEREQRLAIDAARHASKRRMNDERNNVAMHPSDRNNNNQASLRNAYAPSTNLPTHQPYYSDGLPPPKITPEVNSEQKSRSHGTSSLHYETKYGNLLSVIEDLGREIRPTYAGSKMSQDRLRKGIMHARELVRGCLAEVEKKMR